MAFSREVFALDNKTLRAMMETPVGEPRPKVIVVADQGLVEAHPPLQRNIESYVEHHQAVMPDLVAFRALPGGERVKNDLSLLESLLGDLNRYGIDRKSYVLALGGGALLDTVGFAAAVTHRGVRLVRMPTTTLAQCDSGVGVKNGVNMFGKKNFIGSFAVPHAVVNDLALLDTLSDRDWRCGLAETIKVALLKDADFYRVIAEAVPRLNQRDSRVADAIWQRSAELHLQHICQTPPRGGGDPFESQSARPLDLGHWAAHQLEQLSGYELRHGEAVAIGLALDMRYAVAAGLLADNIANDIEQTLRRLGFTLSHPAMGHPELLDGLDAFRQHLGGRLTITLIRDLAAPLEVHAIDQRLMQQCIEELRAVPSSASAPTS